MDAQSIALRNQDLLGFVSLPDRPKSTLRELAHKVFHLHPRGMMHPVHDVSLRIQ